MEVLVKKIECNNISINIKLLDVFYEYTNKKMKT